MENPWKTFDQICGFMTYGLSEVFMPPKKGKKTFGQENLLITFGDEITPLADLYKWYIYDKCKPLYAMLLL